MQNNIGYVGEKAVSIAAIQDNRDQLGWAVKSIQENVNVFYVINC